MEVKVAQSILRSSESGGMQRCGGLSLLRERKEEGEEGRRGRRKEGEKEGEERSHRFSSNYLCKSGGMHKCASDSLDSNGLYDRHSVPQNGIGDF